MTYVILTADLKDVGNINFGFALFHFPHTANCYTAAETSRSIICLLAPGPLTPLNRGHEDTL